MAQTYWITPTLLVGKVPVGIVRAERAQDADRAIALIEAGKTAVLPNDAWSVAADVLQRLGMSHEDIHDRISFAKTGQLVRG